MLEQKRSKKPLWIACGSVIILLLVLLAGYFIALPNVESKNYIATVRNDQPSLGKRMQVLLGSFKSAFLPSSDNNVDLKETQSEIDVAKSDLDATKSQLDSSKTRLTSFREYPLLTWSSDYKKAIDIKKLEQDFISQSNQSLDEFSKVISYAQKNADFEQKIEKSGIFSSDTSNIQSVDELQAFLEKAYSSLNSALLDLKQVTPPQTLKDLHEYNVSATEKIVGTLKQMVDATKSNDFSALETLSTQLEDEANQADKKLKDLENQVVNNSQLRKQLDKVLATDKSIQKLLGN